MEPLYSYDGKLAYCLTVGPSDSLTASLSLSFGVSFDSTQGVAGLGEARDTQLAIVQLRKAMKGDVSDAERYSSLADLYEKVHEKEKAQKAAAKAVELYREQHKKDPDNGRLLAKLGLALWR